MPDGRPELNQEPLIRATGHVQADREPTWRVWQALDRPYVLVLETLRELEAVCDAQPSVAAA